MTDTTAPAPVSKAAPAPSGTVVLGRNLSNFLIELAIGIHSHGMYPDGHPALSRSAARIRERLHGVLEQRSSLSIGVARRQLVIDGVATDANNPVLQGLADRLHRHYLGALTLEAGVEEDEVRDLLTTLAEEPRPPRQPLGLGPKEALQAWPHVRLYPLSYAQLELAGEAGGAGAEEDVRAAQLWVGLARAALATNEATEEPQTDALVVAEAINESAGTAAYDQVIVGYMLQLAAELKTEEMAGAARVRQRVSELISRLSPEALRRLLAMGGDLAQRRQFIFDASESLAADAVLRLVEAAAETSDQSISDALLRLLTKLAAYASTEVPEVKSRATDELRNQVQWLLTGWDLPNPNPERYTLVLEDMARSGAASNLRPSTNYIPEPARLVHMALEVGVQGVAVWRAVVDMLAAGQLGELLEALDTAPPAGHDLARQVWEYVATPEQLREVLSRGGDDLQALDRLLVHLGMAALEPLLDVLANSESRTIRRALFDRLARLGPTIAPVVVERLNDERWYVQRNLLALLAEVGGAAPEVSAAPWARHEDVRVRREAYKLWLRQPRERDRALCAALLEPDPQITAAALNAAQQGCPRVAVPLLGNRIFDPECGIDLRVLGIRALRPEHGPLALDLLLRLVVARKRWWGGVRLARKSPEMLATLSTLRAHWPHVPRVHSLLTRATRAPDAQIRAAATGAP